MVVAFVYKIWLIFETGDTIYSFYKRQLTAKMKTNKVKCLSVGVALALLAVLSAGLISCREQALRDLTPEDSRVYITNYDRSVNFSQFRTFSLPDSVVVESNDRVRTSLSPVEGRFIDQLAATLTGRGFQRVNIGQPADLGVAVIRVNNRYTGVTTNPYAGYYTNYWYGGGFGGFGYDPFFPYYPSYYQFYTVREQFWQVQIVNLRGRTATTGTGQNQLPVVFQADIRGDNLTDSQAVDQAIEAVFAQSTYLQAGR